MMTSAELTAVTGIGQLSAETLVAHYVQAQRALKRKVKAVSRLCPDADITKAHQLVQGQKATLLALANRAFAKTESPLGQPERVLPKDFLKQHPLSVPQSFHGISWADGVQGRPTRIAYDHGTDLLWKCDLETWKTCGEQLEAVPGQIGAAEVEWTNSGIFYQLQPFNGCTPTRNASACVQTVLDGFVVESDTRDRDRLNAWDLVVCLLPADCLSIVETGWNGPHYTFIVEASLKQMLARTLGPLIEFLGNDPTGWSNCKLTRLPNCGRREKGKMQVMMWYSPVPRPLNPICQAKTVEDFAAMFYEAFEENRRAVEEDIQAMRATADSLARLLSEVSGKSRKIAKKSQKSGFFTRSENTSPDMEDRRRTGVEVMCAFRRKLVHMLKQVPRDGVLDISKVPKALINEVAAKYTIGETPDINDREICRCLQRICDSPHRPIGTGKSSFGNLSAADFEKPLNVEYVGERFGAKSRWWKMKKTDGLFNEFAFVARILNSATGKKVHRRERIERPNGLPKDRYHYEWIDVWSDAGLEATASEILAFLRAFASSKPTSLTISELGSDPATRLKAAAALVFKEPVPRTRAIKRNRESSKACDLSRLEIFRDVMRAAQAEDNDLDGLLAEIELRLNAVGWDVWRWIEEDLYRLEAKYWDWDNVAKCGAAAKAVIEEAINSIATRRLKVKHRSPFITASQVYEQVQKEGKAGQLESTLPGLLGESPIGKAARLREGALTKIRRGLRELPGVVREVQNRRRANNDRNAKFRVLALGLNNSNRSASKWMRSERPTNKASVTPPCVVHSTTGGPATINCASGSTAKVPAQPTPEATELGLTIPSIRKQATASRRAGQATYNLKIDQNNGDVLLGKAVRGKDQNSDINGYIHNNIHCIFRAEEISVVVNQVKKGRHGKVTVTGLVAVDDETVKLIPATDVTHGNAGSHYIVVKFSIKPPPGFYAEAPRLVLDSPAKRQVLRVFGRHVVPTGPAQSSYGVMCSTLEAIHLEEVANIFGHWSQEESRKALWRNKRRFGGLSWRL